jgi:hypothetical protein
MTIQEDLEEARLEQLLRRDAIRSGRRQGAQETLDLILQEEEVTEPVYAPQHPAPVPYYYYPHPPQAPEPRSRTWLKVLFVLVGVGVLAFLWLQPSVTRVATTPTAVPTMRTTAQLAAPQFVPTPQPQLAEAQPEATTVPTALPTNAPEPTPLPTEAPWNPVADFFPTAEPPTPEPTIVGTDGWYGGLAGSWDAKDEPQASVRELDAPRVPETENHPVNLPPGKPTATALPASEWNCGNCKQPTPEGWGGGSGSGW